MEQPRVSFVVEDNLGLQRRIRVRVGPPMREEAALNLLSRIKVVFVTTAAAEGDFFDLHVVSNRTIMKIMVLIRGTWCQPSVDLVKIMRCDYVAM